MDRMLRTTAAMTATLVVAVAMSGCTTGPSPEERDAWAQWSDGLLSADTPGLGGAMAGDAAEGLSQLALPSPEVYRAVELRCIGTDGAEFTLSYTGADDSVTTTQEIVCHDGGLLTPIAIPTAVGALEAFGATATSPDGEGEWVALLQK